MHCCIVELLEFFPSLLLLPVWLCLALCQWLVYGEAVKACNATPVQCVLRTKQSQTWPGLHCRSSWSRLSFLPLPSSHILQLAAYIHPISSIFPLIWAYFFFQLSIRIHKTPSTCPISQSFTPHCQRLLSIKACFQHPTQSPTSSRACRTRIGATRRW